MKEFVLADKSWGVMPVLLRIGKIEIPTYTCFVVLAFIVAGIIYFREARRAGQINEFSFLIAVGAFVGSAIGAKLLELLINFNYIDQKNGLLQFLFSGRTVIGGLIGGTIGVKLTKRWIGLKAKRGNLFAPAVAMGIAIGRIGCFFNGCCYGKPSTLPWAVDFGDGILRHPTQLYEAAFMFILFLVLKYGFAHKEVMPGLLFKMLMIGYFIFRFMIEFIRVEKQAFIGLSYFQIISVIVLIYLIFSDNLQIIHIWKQNQKK